MPTRGRGRRNQFLRTAVQLREALYALFQRRLSAQILGRSLSILNAGCATCGEASANRGKKSLASLGIQFTREQPGFDTLAVARSAADLLTSPELANVRQARRTDCAGCSWIPQKITAPVVRMKTCGKPRQSQTVLPAAKTGIVNSQ